MIEPVDLFAIVLALAVLIGSVNHLWIKLPPAIGMLVGSLVVSSLVVVSDHAFHLHVMRWFRGTLTAADLPHFFLDGVLALLLYAGSLHVDVAELRRRGWVILLLATASVIISTLILGAGMWLLFGAIGLAVPLAWCFVLGAILAPTDAVVIENLLRQVSLPQGLRAAIVGEACSMTAPAWCCFCWRSASFRVAALRWDMAWCSLRCCVRSPAAACSALPPAGLRRF
jgi:CPA1 family monovalent cation:H+ antiporter